MEQQHPINQLLNEGRIVWYLDVDTVVLFNLNELVSFLLSEMIE